MKSRVKALLAVFAACTALAISFAAPASATVTPPAGQTVHGQGPTGFGPEVLYVTYYVTDAQLPSWYNTQGSACYNRYVVLGGNQTWQCEVPKKYDCVSGCVPPSVPLTKFYVDPFDISTHTQRNLDCAAIMCYYTGQNAAHNSLYQLFLLHV